MEVTGPAGLATPVEEALVGWEEQPARGRRQAVASNKADFMGTHEKIFISSPDVGGGSEVWAV
jgi:hypothetical protein